MPGGRQPGRSVAAKTAFAAEATLRERGNYKACIRSETNEGAPAYDGAAAARVTGTHTPRRNAASGRGGRVGSPQWRRVASILVFSCLSTAQI